MEKWRFPPAAALGAALLAALLTACGGGGGSNTAVTGPTTDIPPIVQEPGMPTLTGNTATDGYNWINYRRAQLGLSALGRNSRIDAAAQGHSDYQRLNRVITHEQTQGQAGFTGTTLGDRLQAAGYAVGNNSLIGEVISATTNGSGFYQAEELIAAIYHRYVILEPVFREVGTGAATITGSYTYFTADFAVVNGFSGLGRGKIVVYPADQQANVPPNFFSDSESPDPVPGQNEVGYPISVHADNSSNSTKVVVQAFTVAPRGGAALATRLLSFDAGTNLNSRNTAAIVPLERLKAATTYDVSFSGTVAGVAVTRNWSFTTK